MEPQTEGQRMRGSTGLFPPWPLELAGGSTAAQPPPMGTPWGTAQTSLPLPAVRRQGFSAYVPLVLALQELLDLRQDRCAQVQLPQGAGERPGQVPSAPSPARPAHSPPAATYAFWLTMLSRSTTTDRSLMATAESTDVCANKVPVREAWEWALPGVCGNGPYCRVVIKPPKVISTRPGPQ